MKKFTTIFPSASNVHLIKDVGQVANTLAHLKEYEGKLVCFNQNETFSYLLTEASHLKIDFIKPTGKKFFLENAVLHYIEENASKIDVIHFFHLTKETIYYSLHYKKYNPHGKIYVKLDVYNESLKSEIRYSKKKLFNWIHKRKEALFLKSITAMSVENPTALGLLQNRFPDSQEKALLIANGVNDLFLKKSFPVIKDFKEKENIILAVGRVGASDKNFELVLNAFAESDLVDWKLYFVGPIENDFEIKVDTIISTKPFLKSRIRLIGALENRLELYNYYNLSKICCLTSPFESFGITFIESMYFGNYVIGTSGMSSLSYITNNFELGSVIESHNKVELIRLLKTISKDHTLLNENYPKAIRQVENKFYWSKIVEPLINKLSE